ncbi:hypothetical protein [Virgibacillus salexigens]|uniref:Uncharacterized protein n=1 Tax=Virgibacillus massiliensis TaxID=1462526 RepID=A0A024QGY2_9BACI|nr:hypothetical protein [Virgibacillus massiliensis]CDQ41823.1 hypothetical protein BN990_04200 [Virgibacillus massiliensis]
MNFERIKKLIASLPDGPKKNSVVNKLNLLQKRTNNKGREGLHDEFSMKPKGHIQIEEINSNGEVVGVLADQPNLVVDGAEEILLRAFSGDPSRVLYKNRTLRSDSSKVYHLSVDKITEVENDTNIIVSHPNDIWNVVDDEEFNIEYSYYPNTLYLKEEPSVEPNQKAFSLHSAANASTAPLSAEIYSTFSNLFIGLGDGVNYDVSLADERLTYTGSFTGDEIKQTTQVNDEITFTQKISNFELLYQTSNNGGQIGVFINDVLETTIETLDTDLADGEVSENHLLIENLNQEEQSNVSIKFTGADATVTNPVVSINGLKWDAFSKDMNGLIHEFENFTNKFITPTAYNTTSVAPYTIQLEHAPVKPGSVAISYNSVKLEKVETLDEVAEGKYYMDERYGKAYFNRALTGLMVSFETTGQIMQDEKVSNLITKDIELQVIGETPSGDLNGSNRRFDLSFGRIETITVKVDGNVISEGIRSDEYKLNSYDDYAYIYFGSAPAEGSVITVDYDITKTVNVLETDYTINPSKELLLLDQNKSILKFKEDIQELRTNNVYVLDPEDTSNKTVLISQELMNNEILTNLELYYYSDEKPGVPTNYSRQVVLKPKDVNEYPWYALDKGSVQFVAEFEENVPNSSVTIREMGLFDGPRMDDHIKGFTGYPVKAFSLVRVGEARKDLATGLRVTWTITLTNENGDPFQGGK